MSTRFDPIHHEIAKKGVRTVLIKWVMDHHYNPDPNDRFCIEMTGATTPEKAKRIWAILQEPEPKEQSSPAVPPEIADLMENVTTQVFVDGSTIRSRIVEAFRRGQRSKG